MHAHKDSILNFKFPDPIKDINLLDLIEDGLFDTGMITSFVAGDTTLGEFFYAIEAHRESERMSYEELYGEAL